MQTKLFISDKSTIVSIQETFNKEFPYLKLEFFRKKHKAGQAPVKSEMFMDNKTIGEIRNQHTQGYLELNPETLVKDLEASFENNFGLNVQVFRKSGNVWLETTRTDNWTLKQQNDEGKSLHDHFRESNLEDFDYHEQE